MSNLKMPSVLKKHLGRQKETEIDHLTLPVEQWLRYFFHYALEKQKNFYWAWKSFMIVVRKHKNKTVLVLEIFLPQPPFMVQKHIDISNVSNEALVNSLLFLYNHYESSPSLRRNREYSTRFLSFLSFLQMLKNHDIKKIRECVLCPNSKMNRLLVAYIMKTLDNYDVPLIFKKTDDRSYNVSTLLRTGSSLKT